MTYEEALKCMRCLWDIEDAIEECECERNKISATINKAIEALGKQIPKTPAMWGDGYADGELVIEEYECPNCGAVYEIDGETYRYCPNCGQRIAIDWSSEDDI